MNALKWTMNAEDEYMDELPLCGQYFPHLHLQLGLVVAEVGLRSVQSPAHAQLGRHSLAQTSMDGCINEQMDGCVDGGCAAHLAQFSLMKGTEKGHEIRMLPMFIFSVPRFGCDFEQDDYKMLSYIRQQWEEKRCRKSITR